jgi:NRPS condensation-like uncharacterized protein
MKKLNISQVDTIFANGSYPIEFLIYYKNSLKTKKIRSALKKLSSAFWPVFGEYEGGIIHFDNYAERDCFDEQETEQEFDCEATNQAIYEKHCQTNPANMKKLFFLTVMQYRNGTVLIPKMNHLAGDGYSYFYFLSALAAMCQDSYLPFKKHLVRAFYKPQHQRTVLKQFQLEKIELKPVIPDQQLTIKFEEVPKPSVKHIIKEIASGFNQQVSTNDVLSAMIIKKSVEIQRAAFGDDFQLTIPIDVRRYVKAYGSKFFGNGLMFHQVEFKTEDIEPSTFQALAIQIRKSMPTITTESYLKFLSGIEKLIAERQVDQLRPYHPDAGCLITNLSKLPTNKLNFGTGDPDLVVPLTIGKNSAAILANEANFILRIVY